MIKLIIKIIIVGGGIVGWLFVLYLIIFLNYKVDFNKLKCDIILIEFFDIFIVGVGEVII